LKQVVNLSATCFHVELEQFLACFRVARVCQQQLGFLVETVPATLWYRRRSSLNVSARLEMLDSKTGESGPE